MTITVDNRRCDCCYTNAQSVKKLEDLKLWVVVSYDEEGDDMNLLGKWNIIYASFDKKKAEKYEHDNLSDEEGEPSSGQVMGITIDFGDVDIRQKPMPIET